MVIVKWCAQTANGALFQSVTENKYTCRLKIYLLIMLIDLLVVLCVRSINSVALKIITLILCYYGHFLIAPGRVLVVVDA